MRISSVKYRFLIGAAVFSACMSGNDAMAQMNESPWSFSAQNRASIAALMQQVENSSNTSSVVSSSGTGSVTTLVCGGDSADSSAAGNTSCIILNNSDGSINLGQDNSADQSATSESTTTTNVDETINVDEILNTLSGDDEVTTAASSSTDALSNL